MVIRTYQVTLTTAGTAQRLSTSENWKPRKCAVRALSTNTGLMYVGHIYTGAGDVTSANGYELSAKDSCGLDPFDSRGSDTTVDLYNTWLDSSVNGEKVCVICGFDDDNVPTDDPQA